MPTLHPRRQPTDTLRPRIRCALAALPLLACLLSPVAAQTAATTKPTLAEPADPAQTQAQTEDPTKTQTNAQTQAQTEDPTKTQTNAQAQAEATYTRPKLNPIFPAREDWSKLRNAPPEAARFFDPIKYLPLTEDGSFWLSFGGQARFRFEYFNNFATGQANDDAFLLTRLRFHADLHATEYLRVFAEGKSAFSTDRDLPGGQRSLDTDELDLQQLFADIEVPLSEDFSLRVRGGRQELAFGKQRLVSPLDWSNTRRTWDGVSVQAKFLKDYTATAFWTQFVPVQKYEFNDHSSRISFAGFYANGPIRPVPGLKADAYLLWLDNADAGNERYTLGGRLFGKIPETGFGYDLEGAYQFGTDRSLDVSAFFVAIKGSYTFADVRGKPSLFVGFDYASGDDDPDDGDLGTFDQLFPLGHAYLGFIDLVGRQNIIDVNAGVGFTPMEKVRLGLHAHYFRLAQAEDSLFNAGGGAVPGVANESDVGAELDLTLKYTPNEYTSVLLGYSHFFAGDYFDQAGRGRGIDFFYAQFQFTF